ncbi:MULTISPECIES: molybdopterin-dependent oxidoreductase [unclassified Halomonas]|uniref:molybdopterin-dependent oxidoreductase n=1 Tax=unclassified Halomonas TaxID=2609666 RepID=UPI001EF710A0|nr:MULTISPECIES: molybdopterin-dependent oxidoreductase [unclassified Halomonas]MCG7577062.1 molybdopterin-dependent oxidoreductase [Halomonas sp. MMH1-48]MCG7604126.1 molybdopterin-dependent oxidoreductase [Halomonas sp. MM17-34]MCG7613376.1 molybdopterin-dependent oxidoreductase [Halomonas sp. MM17-29]MCG7620150.1 molybdopterin-dependent oxidoreductase [Halomonas sp. DSH1-27]
MAKRLINKTLLILVGTCVFNAAQALDAPTGTVILEVAGNISQTNVGDEAHFDKAMLEALTQRTTNTSTPWHDGVVSFEGPLGRALLEAVGADGEQLNVVALNDYSSKVPVSDFYDHEVILAMRADGQPLRVRDHGPLFIIYPFDETPALLNEEVLTRSVWQIKRIEVE